MSSSLCAQSTLLVCLSWVSRFLIFTGDACNLFAFPSECNFTGLRFNLDLVNLIKENSEATLEGTPFAKYVLSPHLLFSSVA